MILILKDCKYGIKKLDHQWNLIFKLKREQDKQFNSDYKRVSQKNVNTDNFLRHLLHSNVRQIKVKVSYEKVNNTKFIGKNLFYFCGINDASNNPWIF